MQSSIGQKLARGGGGSYLEPFVKGWNGFNGSPDLSPKSNDFSSSPNRGSPIGGSPLEGNPIRVVQFPQLSEQE